MAKSREFLNKNTDLKSLSQDIHNFFRDDDFSDLKIDEDVNGQWFEIQASKTGVKQTLVASRKSLHIIIKGEPNKFQITMITGERGKNYAAAMLIPGFSWAGLLVGLPLGRRYNKKLWKFIENSIESNSSKVTADVHKDVVKTIDDEDPIEILKRGLAKGEITPEEFQERMKLLEP